MPSGPTNDPRLDLTYPRPGDAFFNEPHIVLDKLDELKGEVDKLKFDFQDAFKSGQLKTEKMAQKIQLFEERLNMIQREAQAKWAELAGRLKERAMNEAKVEALMERHNQIIQNFEVRLNQAQKIIENQSLNIVKQQDVIDESRRQIERLKKL